MSAPVWDLYGDLPPPSSGGGAATTPAASKPVTAPSSWSSTATKFMPPVLKAPAVIQRPKPPSKPLVPMSKVKPPPKPTIPKAAVATAATVIHQTLPSFNYTHVAVMGTTDIADEYDPSKPNDYEEWCILRAQIGKRKRAEERNRSLSPEPRSRSRSISPPPQLPSSVSPSSPTPPSVTLAPPSLAPPSAPPKVNLNISGEEAFLARARLSGRAPPSAPPPPAPSPPPPPESIPEDEEDYEDDAPKKPVDDDVDGVPIDIDDIDGQPVNIPLPEIKGKKNKRKHEAGGQPSVARRMMEKMGWKAGQGLGKTGDGIVQPLVAKKTAGRAGIIVAPPVRNAPANNPEIPPEKKPKPATPAAPAPSRIVLLTNMVGPGEVDEDLQDETAEECTKYGPVEKVLIHEVTDREVAPEDAVRIFVKFTKPESAAHAMNEMNGRFFGGKMVKAMFFDEARFDATDLAPRYD